MKVVKIDELIYLSNQYTDFSCKPSYKKYKEGTIFDEEKSVRWNREEVDRKNNLRREKNQMYEKLVNLIYQYIIQETKVSKERAAKIYNYLYEEYHSYGLTECINHLDDLLDLFE